MGHGDDKIKLFFRKQPQGVTCGTDPLQPGGLAQVEPLVFVDDAGGETAVLFQDEGVIWACHQKNFTNFARHQFVKNVKIACHRVKPLFLLLRR